MKSLERSLGLGAVVAISMGAMLGSGLFVLPGLAAGLTGPSIWLAYLVAGLLVLPAAVCKAELATAMPVTGGAYVYIDRTFGPLAGTVAGIALWLSLLLKSSFALVGFGAYLAALGAHHLGVDIPLTPVALGLLGGVAVLNVVGVRGVSRLQKIVVGVALVSLVCLAAYGVFHVELPNYDGHFRRGGMGFMEAVAFVFISYAGVTKVAAVGEEVKDPGRNLPLGILISLIIVAIVYACVTLVLVGVLPTASLGDDLRPIYTLGVELGGPIIGIFAAILGVLTMTSMANAGLLAASRFPFAMSRDDLLPPYLAKVHPRFITPTRSIVLTASVMAAAILLLDVSKLAKLAGSAMIATFVAVNLSVVVLRESNAPWYKPKYRAPLYPFTQIVGIITGIGLIAMMGTLGVLTVIAVATPGALLYFSYGRRRAGRIGVMSQRRQRTELASAPPMQGELPYLDGVLPENASVVVAILGDERSPETLVDIGVSLAGGELVEVLHLTDVPEQTELDLVLDEEPRLVSLRRRMAAMAEQSGVEIEVSAVVTRDVVRTVHHVASRTHCEWIVLDGEGVRRQGITPVNPLGWLVDHLPAKMAVLKDDGVRHIRAILAFTNGTHDDLVLETADHLASELGARITWVAHTSDSSKDAALAKLQALAGRCEAPTDTVVLTGSKPLQEIAGLTTAHDLLVLGAPERASTRFRQNPADQLTKLAACSVLRVRPPRIAPESS